MVFDSIAKHHHYQCGSQSLPHVIISNLEHDSVELTAREMEKNGRIGICVCEYSDVFVCACALHMCVCVYI